MHHFNCFYRSIPQSKTSQIAVSKLVSWVVLGLVFLIFIDYSQFFYFLSTYSFPPCPTLSRKRPERRQFERRKFRESIQIFLIFLFIFTLCKLLFTNLVILQSNSQLQSKTDFGSLVCFSVGATISFCSLLNPLFLELLTSAFSFIYIHLYSLISSQFTELWNIHLKEPLFYIISQFIIISTLLTSQFDLLKKLTI